MNQFHTIRKMMLCLMAMLCLMCINASAATTPSFDEINQENTYVTITGTGVRMRYGPGLNYGYYKTSPKKGAKLLLLGQSGDWYEVQWGNDVAYVFKQYAKVTSQKVNAPKPASKMVQITGTGVRLREGPGLNYDFLKWKDGTTRAPKKGEKLVCVGEEGDWYKVSYAGGYYYIFKQYAKRIK